MPADYSRWQLRVSRNPGEAPVLTAPRQAGRGVGRRPRAGTKLALSGARQGVASDSLAERLCELDQAFTDLLSLPAATGLTSADLQRLRRRVLGRYQD